MLISRSGPQPRSKKTPTGGRIIAKMILQMSLCRSYVSAHLRLERRSPAAPATRRAYLAVKGMFAVCGSKCST
jgi:hypothetical protein